MCRNLLTKGQSDRTILARIWLTMSKLNKTLVIKFVHVLLKLG